MRCATHGHHHSRVGNFVETMNWLGHSTVQASLLYQFIVFGCDVEIAEALSKLAANTELALTDPLETLETES